MSRPVLVYAVCDRPGKGSHVLAKVYASPDGQHEVELWFLVRGLHRGRGQRVEPLGGSDGQLTYCSACRTEYPLASARLQAAVAARQRWVVLEPRPFVRDPFGVADRQHNA